MKSLWKLISLIRDNKGKILLLLISVIAWFLVLFPFSDLSDLLGGKIAELTQNQLFVQFSRMQISWWPLGVQFGDASIDTPSTGPLTIQELTVSPSVSSVFSRIPYGTVNATGLFRGNAEINIKAGSKSESGNDRQKIEINAEHLNLQDLRDVAQLPLLMKGQMDLQTIGLVDLTFSDQPEADITIHAEKFELPAQTFNSIMGPINIPDLRLSSVDLKGKLGNGRLTIEEGRIGHDGDEIHGTIKGGIALTIPSQGSPRPQMGPYSFDVDLTIKSGLEEKLSLFLVAVGQFKSPVGDSSRYQFKLSAQNIGFPPSMSALH